MTFNDDLLKTLNEIGDSDAGFTAIDKMLAVNSDERPDSIVIEIGDVLDEQIGPVFDVVPRGPALYACFMYGVAVGQKLKAEGVKLS